MNPGLASLPFLTAELRGTGGTIKTREEDFVVEEIPLYAACGEGTHLYAYIEKKGMATIDALVQIARALNVPREQIGYAGLKDARAVTRQWISIEHTDPEKLRQLETSRIKVLQTSRHTNKLKLGHLAANRFVIRLRNCNMPVKEAMQHAQNIMVVLKHRGVPNFLGPNDSASVMTILFWVTRWSKGICKDSSIYTSATPIPTIFPKSVRLEPFMNNVDTRKPIQPGPIVSTISGGH